MSNHCEVVKDLLPLYVEQLTSDSSAQLVEQHLAECTDCQHQYASLKQDFEQPITHQVEEKSEQLLAKLSKYQQNIKLFGVLTAMLMSCIITGANVQFLATLPFLIFTPYVCRVFYHKSWPIIVSSLPFALIGAALSGENGSYIVFFIALSLLLTCIGVGGAVLMIHGNKQLATWRKAAFVIPGIALIVMSSTAYFSFFGNPISYVSAMNKSKHYVQETYEEGTLTFKGVSYNFKDSRHSGQFEYVINGVRQTAYITYLPDGHVIDEYKFALETTFSKERAADLRADFAAAINYDPTTVTAEVNETLHITHDELDNTYFHLSYDLERREKATALRRSAAEKLDYHIAFGTFVDELTQMSEDQFIAKAVAIYKALHDQNSAFNRIHIQALDPNGDNIQSVQFVRGATEQDVIGSYKVTAF